VATAGPALGAGFGLGPLGLQLDAGLDLPLAPTNTEFQGESVYRQMTGLHALLFVEVYPLTGF
jgi:hypothetical protein